jgi:flagellar assembly protein FliH|uniref:Flagellar assembly protein FliH n=1 Tax=Desulfobacca acetoxidans TaxID=60893 RepID=A0A7C3YZC6_9BACT
MFTSNRVGDIQPTEEFQLPGLEEQSPAPSEPAEFQPWHYGASESSRPEDLEASAKAEEILAAAHLRAQEIERQAYEQGFHQGLNDGQEVGRRALEEVVKRLQSLVTSLEQDRETLFRQREDVLLEMVLLVAKKLVCRELSLHPESIRQIIEEGFRQVSQQEGMKVLVSPPDFEVLRQENLDSWPPGVELRADGTISPGGFRLETALGEVDGTRETRWALVVQAVQQALERLDVTAGTD